MSVKIHKTGMGRQLHCFCSRSNECEASEKKVAQRMLDKIEQRSK